MESSAPDTAKTGRQGDKKRHAVPERKAAMILDPSRIETDFGARYILGCCIRDAGGHRKAVAVLSGIWMILSFQSGCQW
jgi:hypothetical protein